LNNYRWWCWYIFGFTVDITKEKKYKIVNKHFFTPFFLSLFEHCRSLSEHCLSLLEHCHSLLEHCRSLSEHCFCNCFLFFDVVLIYKENEILFHNIYMFYHSSFFKNIVFRLNIKHSFSCWFMYGKWNINYFSFISYLKFPFHYWIPTDFIKPRYP